MTMQHADLDMEHCAYHFSSTSPPLTFETERSLYAPSTRELNQNTQTLRLLTAYHSDGTP